MSNPTAEQPLGLHDKRIAQTPFGRFVRFLQEKIGKAFTEDDHTSDIHHIICLGDGAIAFEAWELVLRRQTCGQMQELRCVMTPYEWAVLDGILKRCKVTSISRPALQPLLPKELEASVTEAKTSLDAISKTLRCGSPPTRISGEAAKAIEQQMVLDAIDRNYNP